MANIFSNIWELMFPKKPKKKNKEDMISEEQLISYKQNFTNQKFQWIKTQKEELIGKLVTCRDVQFKGKNLIAVFDDGSSIPVQRLNNDLMMIHGDMQPLSKSEARELSGFKSEPVKAPAVAEIPAQNHQQAKDAPPRHAAPVAQAAPAVNPFEMFNSDETELAMKIKIKLPDKKLLKMMYNNAEDKEQFLKQLTSYVQQALTADVIESSLTTILDPKSKTAKVAVLKTPPASEPEIQLTEIQDGE